MDKEKQKCIRGLAKNCLLKYLEAQVRLKDALTSGSEVEQKHIIRKINEAFHNFKALDGVARLQGLDLGSCEEMQEISININKTQLELHHLIESHRGTLMQELLKLQKQKATLKTFHSGNRNDPIISESV